MRPFKLSTNFTPYTDASFSNIAAFIVESMEDNPYFPGPIPTLEGIRILYAEYKNWLVKAASLDREAVARKNAARQQLTHELARLSLYVMYIADGSEVILVSSGFSFTKTPEVSKIKSPGNVTVKNGRGGGQLISTIKAVKGTKIYSHEIATDELMAKGIWNAYSSSRRSFTFTELTQGMRYYFRIAAIGSGNQKIYSPVANMWAQ